MVLPLYRSISPTYVVALLNFVMNLPLIAMLGTPEILVIAVVVLVLFGARKIPELMKGMGQGVREFKKASKDDPETK